ncbi:MAG: iron complex outermembrane receptor protein [Flavobacteriaceae bacterium]|jgi:iron complex outermembrane receptor protein
MKTRLISKICGLLVLFPLATHAQHTIQGEITNEQGEALYGAKVLIEGTYLGAYTNENGIFRFEDLKNNEYTLKISHSGYEPMNQNVTVYGENVTPKISLIKNPQMLLEILVEAIRANNKLAVSYTDIKKEEIKARNYGQDLPYLLRHTPSAVVTSDAGAGVGYTGIRIRGVDPSRTNVTINGIPLNDPESHGVYWVNMPDFASSVDQIQVVRGVGTSSNGIAAFGASINISTNQVKKKAYGKIDNSFGSFNTLRHSVSAGTGLINKKFTVDTRLSRITSDGYLDRGSSNLHSFYMSAAWLGKKSRLRMNVFSGKEITYQSWYGTPESVINGSVNEITAYADRNYIFGEDRESLLNSGRTYNFYTYDNQVDNYQQSHYQLMFAHNFSKKLNLDVAAHYTRGEGYYEQFRTDDDFGTYGFAPVILSADTINSTDLIRRRWLDNHFYGAVFALNYDHKGLEITWGGSANQYLGAHFGEVIWAEFASTSNIRDRYYDNDAVKTDLGSYIKALYNYKKFRFYADFQYRHVGYEFVGFDDVSGTIEELDQTVSYDFINPKAGLIYNLNDRQNLYLSLAVANREPVRTDFRESTPASRPDTEQLINLEFGHRFNARKISTTFTGYYMSYKDQLILTGEINDVGAYTRTNVDKSYRAGIELSAGYQVHRHIELTGNITLSQNKIASFNEYVDNYDVGGQDTIAHRNTDLAFSPNVVAAFGVNLEVVKGLDVTLLGKYVGQQFLDNTSTDTRMINSYFISTLDISYTLTDVLFEEIQFGVRINNLFNEVYESNGYTWGYIAGGERTVENFYYPQAGRNFLGRVTILF